MPILGLHHIAIICSDYHASRRFYTDILGCRFLRETYRADRDSYKCDLLLPTPHSLSPTPSPQIELFSFPAAPPRPSYPEARGLRHLALAVSDLDAEVLRLQAAGIVVEPIRLDDETGQRFTFFPDPDGLPIEFYEASPNSLTPHP